MTGGLQTQGSLPQTPQRMTGGLQTQGSLPQTPQRMTGGWQMQASLPQTSQAAGGLQTQGSSPQTPQGSEEFGGTGIDGASGPCQMPVSPTQSISTAATVASPKRRRKLPREEAFLAVLRGKRAVTASSSPAGGSAGAKLSVSKPSRETACFHAK